MKWLLLILLASCSSSNIQTNKKTRPPIIVLISIDGYRHDYTKIYNPRFLSEFRAEGVSAELKPIFPSYTFPNHYSIVTGLYAENHGIIHNSFYDPARGDEYSLRNRRAINNAEWYGGEPIWVSAEKQGKAKIKGYLPTYNLSYDDKKPNIERSKTVLKWLNKSESSRPSFITLYFSSVDASGHKYGPISPEVGAAIKDVDKAIEYLVTESRKKHSNINVIILSDHGMEDLTTKKTVFLNDYAKDELIKFQIIGKGPIVQIYNKFKVDNTSLYKKLKKQNKYFYTYKRKNIPNKYRYKNNHRAPDILLVAKKKYLVKKSRLDIKYGRQLKASHGYDPSRVKSMRGIFYANGPLFKNKYKVSAFENIHIQPLLAHLLGITNHSVDGKLNVLKKILLKKKQSKN